MPSKKQWLVVNLSLGLFALLLALNLAEVRLPSAGRTASYFDSAAPLCVVEWKEQATAWNDLDRCCLEARAQLECAAENKVLPSGEASWDCHTGRNLHYRLNNKAFYYCQQQDFWR